MKAEELLEQTQFLEKELGPCLLVVKCYEQIDGRENEARAIARQLSHAELGRLGQLTERGFALGPLSEQFVRVAYAFEVAGMRQQATSVFRAFVDTVRRSTGRPLDGMLAFRLAVAQVLADDPTTSLNDLLDPNSFGATVARAWQSGSRDLLESCLDELEDLVEMAENEDRIAPWEDIWHYVLLRRLKLSVAK